jgi:transglutaminase-like putative cysteine protease
MSVTVLDHPALRHSPRKAQAESSSRSLVQLGAFAALGLYGVLRWGTMLKPVPVGRLLGLWVLAVAIVALGQLPAVRRRPVAIMIGVVGAVAILPISGIALTWITHVRIAVTGQAIGDGLSGLPRVLVPYDGINYPVREVIVMGAGVLLLDAAMILAFAPRSLGEVRSAVAALPLVVLAIVPSALTRPSLPYLHGMILFALLAALMWGERVRRLGSVAAVGVVITAGLAAMLAAPGLDPRSPWLNFQALAGSLAPGHGESFDWSQHYGPLKWPRTGHQVLDVQAQQPDYWKAEDLDSFDGTGWVAGASGDAGPSLGVDRSALTRWTQTLHVTLRAMSTNDVIAAGAAAQPTHVSGVVLPGGSPGTWLAASTLGPGDSYLVKVYTPHPTPTELAAAGGNYGDPALGSYLSITLPAFSILDRGSHFPVQSALVTFAGFGLPAAPASSPTYSGAQTRALVAASPYRRAYALARRLAAGASSPYAYVQAVLRYLGHGYTYNEFPLPSRYPLLSFLFDTKTGYCQQFAGAMALLLRMGGIPARVAAGFTTGNYDAPRKQYVVSDIDAHAWVEAWFPHYGWVRFDPTPAAAPARGGHVPLPSLAQGGVPTPLKSHIVKKAEPLPRSSRAKNADRGRGTSTELLIGLFALAVLLSAFVAAALRIRRARREDQLIELERAFSRCGRPLDGGVTLAVLEHRFRYSPDAAAYVRALRVVRFGGGGPPPTFTQRKAVREQLASGLGAPGRLRAWWALPPLPGSEWSFRRRPRAS